MTAQELEDRIVAAEKNPTLIRPLIADFKAYKDEQVSDLTVQINALPKQEMVDSLNSTIAAVTAEKDAQIASLQQQVKDITRKCESIIEKLNHPEATIEDVKAEAEKSSNQAQLDEIDKLIAEEEQRLADLQAKRAELSK